MALACLACLTGIAACQQEQPVKPAPASSPESRSGPAASGCDIRPGDVLVRQGGTFPIDPAATIRAGLQYEVSRNPRSWKVMFLTDGGSISMDLKRGDTLSVAGQTMTVRDACVDQVVLTLGARSPGNGTGGPAATG